MSSSKNWPLTLRQVFLCLRPLRLLGFCLGWSGNFEGYESGQIQSVNLLQNMVSNRTLNTSHPLQTTNWTLKQGKGGGVVEPKRRLEGKQFTKLGRNTNMTDCFSSLYTLIITCRKVPLQVNFF